MKLTRFIAAISFFFCAYSQLVAQDFEMSIFESPSIGEYSTEYRLNNGVTFITNRKAWNYIDKDGNFYFLGHDFDMSSVQREGQKRVPKLYRFVDVASKVYAIGDFSVGSMNYFVAQEFDLDTRTLIGAVKDLVKISSRGKLQKIDRYKVWFISSTDFNSFGVLHLSNESKSDENGKYNFIHFSEDLEVMRTRKIALPDEVLPNIEIRYDWLVAEAEMINWKLDNQGTLYSLFKTFYYYDDYKPALVIAKYSRNVENDTFYIINRPDSVPVPFTNFNYEFVPFDSSNNILLVQKTSFLFMEDSRQVIDTLSVIKFIKLDSLSQVENINLEHSVEIPWTPEKVYGYDQLYVSFDLTPFENGYLVSAVRSYIGLFGSVNFSVREVCLHKFDAQGNLIWQNLLEQSDETELAEARFLGTEGKIPLFPRKAIIPYALVDNGDEYLVLMTAKHKSTGEHVVLIYSDLEGEEVEPEIWEPANGSSVPIIITPRIGVGTYTYGIGKDNYVKSKSGKLGILKFD